MKKVQGINSKKISPSNLPRQNTDERPSSFASASCWTFISSDVSPLYDIEPRSPQSTQYCNTQTWFGVFNKITAIQLATFTVSLQKALW